MAQVPYDEAISMAIFAINTIAEPSASSDEDLARLDEMSDDVLETLVDIRTTLKEMSS